MTKVDRYITKATLECFIDNEEIGDQEMDESYYMFCYCSATNLAQQSVLHPEVMSCSNSHYDTALW